MSPLLDGLLNPIPGENPSGQSLRFDPVYDKIREARREEEAFSVGVWSREVKKADFAQVIKLSTDVLATKSKDIQIAVWLTEALLAKEKFPGLTQGLDLLRELLETFWDTLYPEIEDGDLEMRAGPLAWVGSRLDVTVRKVPLTKNKLDWLKYQESRRVGYEADAAGNDAKIAARQTAIEEKKCTAEEFDEAVRSTGDAYYQQMAADLTKAVESLQALDTVCDSKFGADAPNFSNLRTALEDVQQFVAEFWRPAPEPQPEPPPEEESFSETSVEPVAVAAAAAAPARKLKLLSEEPASPEDAASRVLQVARFLRHTNVANPIPYMLLRALRWGELRASGQPLDASLLESPSSETRQQLKKLASEGSWNDLLEASERSMAQPCGRAWLDLQRYTVRACEGMGNDQVAAAVRAGLRSLVADYPDLLSATLADDTPAANGETQTWIRESILPPPVEQPEEQTALIHVAAMAPANNGSNGMQPNSDEVSDLAQQAARAGRIQEAVQLLSQEIAKERSGRARFQRNVQLAAICLSARHETIAYPILVELAEEIERRKLEEWEESRSLAEPLALLLRCMEKLGYDNGEKQRVYQKICRLDPVLALSPLR